MAVLASGGAAAAQEGTAVDLDVAQPDLSSHPRVATVLTAPAELGGADVQPSSVTVVEDGDERPVELLRLPGDRLEVVLVVDTSGSMRGAPFVAAQAAAAAFVDRLPEDASVGLVSFGSTPVVASPLTDDHTLVIAAIGSLQAAGETALYDGVALAVGQLSDEADRRRSVVVLSDGGDTASAGTLEAAVAAVAVGEARLDVVELVTTESDPATLGQLAAAGGGGVASADDPSGLDGLFDRIAASLANEYDLTWRSSSEGPTPVVVRLEQGGVVAERLLTLDYPTAVAPVTTTPAVAAPAPGLQSGSEPRATTWMLAAGALCVGLALLLLGLALFVPRAQRRRRARLGPSSVAASTGAATTSLGELSGRATAAVEGALDRHGHRRGLDAKLEQAGVALRAGEYVVLAGSAVVVAGAVGLLLSGSALGVLLALLVGGASRAILSVLARRRRARFAEQLGDTLQLLAGSLRAGYGLLQAIDALGREAPEPTNSEFRRLVVETRLGRDLSESLAAMAERLGTEDFAWVVQAIDINREVGGDLAEVLDNVGETIRERNQVQRQVKALTAEGRMSAYVLIALPFVLAVALQLMNPEYFRLLTFGPGLVMSMVGVVMLGIGALWFRVLCRLDY
ncbi:MAG TPA: type II secretion system F family protein [Acidimicrobiales bacterium]|nr:type II secretion system F family protein [Acidimicrobiales bacterium]